MVGERDGVGVRVGLGVMLGVRVGEGVSVGRFSVAVGVADGGIQTMVGEGGGVSVTLTGSAGAAKRSSAEQAVNVIARMQSARKLMSLRAKRSNPLATGDCFAQSARSDMDERKFIMAFDDKNRKKLAYNKIFSF